VLRASTSEGEREVVRQQFTFSPLGTTLEREEYALNLDGVTRLELTIVQLSIGRMRSQVVEGVARRLA
jgi:hypothetical protein